ncbi:unnamed protein product, partial [marine sediment metagenome]
AGREKVMRYSGKGKSALSRASAAILLELLPQDFDPLAHVAELVIHLGHLRKMVQRLFLLVHGL